MRKLVQGFATVCVLLLVAPVVFAVENSVGYKLLTTNKTSTMEKEMNEAGDGGFRFGGVMGGQTALGGSEVVVIMTGSTDATTGRFRYKLLATSKTSTMQKEMQQAADEGYEYKGQTIFKTSFSGQECVVILEQDRERKDRTHYEYKLLATSKTSTMQKELTEAGGQGFEFVGITVANTAFGGAEVVSILRRVAR